VLSTRINCVNSASAITRLIRDGFGIGVLPLKLVQAEVANGNLMALEGAPSLPDMDIVATWRTGSGIALVEDIVEMAQEVSRTYKGHD